MLSFVSNFLYYVIVPYVLALAMAWLSDRARFAHVDKSDLTDGYLREPPSSEEPALIARVVGDGFVARAASATVLELVRKGALVLEYVPTSRDGMLLDGDLSEKGERRAREKLRAGGRRELETPRVSLAPGARDWRLTLYERLTLDLVFADGRTSATAEEIEDLVRACPGLVSRHADRLSAEADRDLRDRHLVEGVSPSLMGLAVAVLVAYALGGVFVVGFDVVTLVFFGLPGLAAMFAYARPREVYTAEGRTLLVRCRAFQRYLGTLTRLSDARLADVTLWGEQLVYGVATGVSGRAARELFTFRSSEPSGAVPSWYVAYARAHDGEAAGDRPAPPRGGLS